MIKVLVTILSVMVILSAFNRFRKRQSRFSLVAVWSLLWIGVIAFANWPGTSDYLARMMGMGRGMDLIVFVSILAIFYGMYRVYVKVEKVERKMTQMIRQEALRNVNSDSD